MRSIPCGLGLAAATLLLLGPTACNDSTGPGGTDSADVTSSVRLLLTDAPDDVAHAWVDIQQVYLQGGDAQGRLVLFDGPSGPTDLIPLADQAIELAHLDIPSGSYGQLRVVVNGAVVETEDGHVYATDTENPLVPLSVDGEIQCPSCDTSGFKVLLQGRDLALVDVDETLVLDFDVAESFARPAGQSGKWTVHPTIRLFESLDQAD